MRAEEFDKLTEEQLQQKANGCFIAAENQSIYQQGGDAQRRRLLLEAQFYLTAVAKKRDDRTAKRDFRMEVAVIVLISIEIILSIVFGFLGLSEGKQQARVLAHMDTSTAATANAMTGVTNALDAFADEQKRSSNSLKEMSRDLQSSAGAARDQLHILRQEQADALAERSKKPELALLLGGHLLNPMQQPPKIIVRAESDTSMTIDFVLLNHGSATANAVIFRALVWDKEVSLLGEGPFILIPVPPTTSYDYAHVYITPIGNVRVRSQFVLPLTFIFPKGQKAFHVTLSADADEIESGTPLATLDITPSTQTLLDKRQKDQKK